MSGEPLEIRQTLGRIEGKLDSFMKRQDEHHSTLYGNGAPGLKTRLDRLEQTEATRSKLVWLAITAAGTAFLKSIASWLRP